MTLLLPLLWALPTLGLHSHLPVIHGAGPEKACGCATYVNSTYSRLGKEKGAPHQSWRESWRAHRDSQSWPVGAANNHLVLPTPERAWGCTRPAPAKSPGESSVVTNNNGRNGEGA